MLESNEVIAAIDSERDYQGLRWGTDGTAHKHSLGAWLIYMSDYLAETINNVTRREGYGAALPTLRKFAALAAACHEEHFGTRAQLYEVAERMDLEHAELEEYLCDIEQIINHAKSLHKNPAISAKIATMFGLAFAAMKRFGAPLRDAGIAEWRPQTDDEIAIAGNGLLDLAEKSDRRLGDQLSESQTSDGSEEIFPRNEPVDPSEIEVPESAAKSASTEPEQGKSDEIPDSTTVETS